MTTNYCSLGCLKQTPIATALLRMTPAQKTLKAIRMCFDLLADSSSMPRMTTNYCSLGCLKQTPIATALLRMRPAQQTLKAIQICFDLLARLELPGKDADELLLATLLETETDGDTTADDDTSEVESEGNMDVL